jgi:ankyrin repeat protein
VKGRLKIVKALVLDGIDVDSRVFPGGPTAMMLAASEGHSEIVLFLLEEEADVNVRNETRESALIWATQSGHTEVVKILLLEGANVNARSEDGNTAFTIAARKGHIRGYAEVMEIIKEAGANV